MARKKYKLSKKQRQKLMDYAMPAFVILLSFLAGALITQAMTVYHTKKPITNLVWATDNTVTIPGDLRTFLMSRNDCEHYKGKDSPKGIGLWAIYQVSQSKFAKIAYGCSWDLKSYIMAVKQGQSWSLVQPSEYFAPFKDSSGVGDGAVPSCVQLQKYRIDKSTEPFCIDVDGTARVNEQN